MPDHLDRTVVCRPDPARLAELPVVALLTVDGDGDTIAATDANPCVNDAVAAYFLESRVRIESARCAKTS